jgi:hypothetical protein
VHELNHVMGAMRYNFSREPHRRGSRSWRPPLPRPAQERAYRSARGPGSAAGERVVAAVPNYDNNQAVLTPICSAVHGSTKIESRKGDVKNCAVAAAWPTHGCPSSGRSWPAEWLDSTRCDSKKQE